jgi:uncharacterized protein (DUF2225 family)
MIIKEKTLLMVQNILLLTKIQSSFNLKNSQGKHIVREDFTVCPHCEFPAIASEFSKYVSL